MGQRVDPASCDRTGRRELTRHAVTPHGNRPEQTPTSSPSSDSARRCRWRPTVWRHCSLPTRCVVALAGRGKRAVSKASLDAIAMLPVTTQVPIPPPCW